MAEPYLTPPFKFVPHTSHRAVDLTGQTFGELIVLGYVGDCQYACKCSCGAYKTAYGDNLRKAISTTSCGNTAKHPRSPKPLCSIDGCNRTKSVHGYCTKHRVLHDYGEPTAKDEVRFWGKVNKTASCWLWTKGITKFGYGNFSFGQQPLLAHRVSFYFTHKRWPAEGMFLLHSCDTPACVNPAHLREGTHQDNMDDMVAKGANRYRWHVAYNGQRKPLKHWCKELEVDYCRALILIKTGLKADDFFPLMLASPRRKTHRQKTSR